MSNGGRIADSVQNARWHTAPAQTTISMFVGDGVGTSNPSEET